MSTFAAKGTTWNVHRPPDSSYTSIGQVTPMPDTKPLKMCVKLARDIGDDCCHGWEAEWDGTTAAKLIDARIRPLIEALKMAHDACNGLWNNPINALPEIEAALKSAGAE